jgi:hypothetical protein
MANYKGKPVTVNSSAQSIAERFSDLSSLNSFVDQLPAEERQKIGDVEFEKDAISIKNPQIGSLRFAVTECSPKLIKLACASPVSMALQVNLTAIDDNRTEVATDIDINIPAMLRPFIAPHMQRAADQFGTLMAKVAAGNGI